MRIKLYVNEKDYAFETHGERRLSDVLREDLGLLATKVRCGSADCGACIVLADGELCTSCLVPVGIMQSFHITTFEHFTQTPEFTDIDDVIKDCDVSLREEEKPFFFFTLNSIINNMQEITLENIELFYKNFAKVTLPHEDLLLIARRASDGRKKRIFQEKSQLNAQKPGKK